MGPIEKILEALEQKVSAQNSHFPEISSSKSDDIFSKITKKFTFPCL